MLITIISIIFWYFLWMSFVWFFQSLTYYKKFTFKLWYISKIKLHQKIIFSILQYLDYILIPIIYFIGFFIKLFVKIKELWGTILDTSIISDYLDIRNWNWILTSLYSNKIKKND